MTEQDCKRCKDYRKCLGLKDWFNYAEIRWCVYQVVWILSHYETFKAGRWPKDPDNDNNAGQRRIKTEASFVKAAIIIGELEVRLKTTGTSGESLVAQCKAGETLETLDDEVWEVLMFVKGLNRKRMSFNAWKRQRRYRQR